MLYYNIDKMKNLKRIAMAESFANVGSGLLLSIFVFQPIIFWYFNIDFGVVENALIALYFTIISVFRGYIWRIYFHKWFYHKYMEDNS